MDLKAMFEESGSIKELLKDIHGEFAEFANDYFRDQFKKIFEENPDLNSVSWTQYTPFWQDGDPCEFSSNYRYCSINNDGDDGDDDKNLSSARNKEIRGVIRDFVGSFGHEALLLMFGDHAKVIVSREGLSVEEYDHE